jgi:hypothetical protein
MTSYNNSNETPIGNIPYPTSNTPWVISAALCIWFLYFTPSVLWVNLFSVVYSIYLVCARNTLFTTSTLNGHKAVRTHHIWAGRRFGVVLGVVGFITGFVLTWYLMDPTKNLGFSIGITYGVIAQIQSQIMQYRSARRFQRIKAQMKAKEYQELSILQDEQEDERLRIRVVAMINLFVLACGIPGLMRLIGCSLLL